VLGYNVNRYKLMAFVLSATLAGGMGTIPKAACGRFLFRSGDRKGTAAPQVSSGFTLLRWIGGLSV